ncbi:MAG: sulfite exporter TauE/SafE family protein [Patescibacteria group bacterium]
MFEILSKLNETNIGYGLIFFIGILSSFHCIGMCGGLVIAYSVKNKNSKPYQAHWQYNFGRLISYTTIGGILGGSGSFFGVNPAFTGIITLLASIFMVLMGLSLLTNFKFLKRIRLRTPLFIAKYIYRTQSSNKPKAPFIIGMLNGFMPCGPLQAIQLYALASGSFLQGAFSMAAFSLGTIPLMFGFGNFITFISKDHIKKIMKLSGVIVVVLGIFMFNRGLVNFGYGFNGFSLNNKSAETQTAIDNNDKKYQIANMDLTYQGYQPNVLHVKVSQPVHWVINVKQMSGCTNEIIMPEYNIDKKLELGENIIEFTPTKTGEIKFSCWMKMVWGKFIVE